MEDLVVSSFQHYTRINPKLDIQMSWWGMNGLEADRNTEQMVADIAEAGFTSINGFLPAPEQAQTWRKLLEKHGLGLSVNAYPSSVEDFALFMEQAKQYGDIDHINVQVMTPFVIGEEAVNLLRQLMECAANTGIATSIETHRGTITQDLLRTISYIEEIADLRLTIDLSHYVLAGEMHTISSEAEAHIQKVLTRTSSIHARVSNGEQIQVNVGPDGQHVMLPHFLRWWRSGISHWLKTASSTFPFVIELGPQPYAITVDEFGDRKQEISNRWEQSLLLMNIAKKAWQEAIESEQDVK